MRMRLSDVLIIASLFVATQAHADRRNYVWTYQYVTLPKGGTEMEFYQTTSLGLQDAWEYRLELEQGLTERWDIGIYQIFRQSEGGPFKWDAFQVRSRYRIGEEGQYLMDPLIYLEYNRNVDLDKPHKLEAKLILAKTVDRFNLSLNPTYETTFSPHTEDEAGLDVGTSWQYCPQFTVGLESTSRWEVNGSSEKTSYFGPTISLSGQRIWYTVGVAWGITDDSDNTWVRFLMGVPF